jgi:uncharacterized protein YjiS (DUF1127 family)
MTTERLSFDLLDVEPRRPGVVPRVLEAFAGWRTRARQRAALARLSAHMLRDIGLSEADVWRETRVRPWER